MQYEVKKGFLVKLKERLKMKPIRAIIKTKTGLRTILTGYHIKNNSNCIAMYSSSTGKLLWGKNND